MSHAMCFFHSSNKRVTKMYLIISKQGKITPKTITIVFQCINNENQHFMALKKAPVLGAWGGLWQIRTVDLFRVKEAL